MDREEEIEEHIIIDQLDLLTEHGDVDAGVGGMTHPVGGGAQVVTAHGQAQPGQSQTGAITPDLINVSQCRGYEWVKNQSHLPGEAPDALVPVDGGGGAAVGVAPQHHALPQPPGESTLVSGDGGRHNNLVTTHYQISDPGGIHVTWSLWVCSSTSPAWLVI